jgi:hypothetical protein
MSMDVVDEQRMAVDGRKDVRCIKRHVLKVGIK